MLTWPLIWGKLKFISKLAFQKYLKRKDLPSKYCQFVYTPCCSLILITNIWFLPFSRQFRFIKVTQDWASRRCYFIFLRSRKWRVGVRSDCSRSRGPFFVFASMSLSVLVNFQFSELHSASASHLCLHWLPKLLQSPTVTSDLPLWTRPRIVEMCLPLPSQLCETENVLHCPNWMPTPRDLACCSLNGESLIILFP